MEEQKDTKGNVLEEAATMMVNDSNRLRNLLTKPPNNADSSNEDKNRDRILKELLNQQDEDSSRTDNRRGGINRGPIPGPSDIPKTSSSSSGNNMLRQLLNDKSDDDDLETKGGVKTKSELLQQLLKPERDIEDKKNDLQSQDDTLLRSLGFPPSSPNNRKRQNDDKDDNPNKRSGDGSQVSSSRSSGSKLWERNQMLASLLAKQPNNHQPIPPLPADEISAIPQEKLPRIVDPNKNIMTNMMNQNVMQNNTRNTNARMSALSQNNSYLNSVLSNNAMHRLESRQHQGNQVNSVCYSSPATSTTDTNNTGWDNSDDQVDPILSHLLDEVIDFVPEEAQEGSDGQQVNNFQKGLSETMAINIIQKSLMQCESVVKSLGSSIQLVGTPPTYSAATASNQTSGAVFPPPPNYSQSKFPQRMQVRAGTSQQYTGQINSQLLLQQQRKQLLHQQQQQEQKRRLLQQQKQQQLLIPSNAAAEMNSIQNIDSLLNNTVAPNVSLQRSASVPEPQLSPGYGGQISQQNQRVVNQQPYSPHSQLTSPLGQQSFPQTPVSNYQNQGARLSPQAQFSSQLSPRQAYPQGNAQNANWQQTQARLSVQQNPMLSAQLTATFQRPPQQQQRSMNSPGTVPTRHSPYPADQFPPPSSPNSAFNSQYLRLQRANSAPTATTQLPGGLGSPRPYTGREHHPHPYPAIPPPPQRSPHDVPTRLPVLLRSDGYTVSLQWRRQGSCPTPPTAWCVRQWAHFGVRTAGVTRCCRRQNGAGATSTELQPTPSQLMSQQQVSDLDSLGINFEMAAGASDSPKLWGAMGSDMGSMSPQPATSRSSMDEGRQGDQKSSLLQKLLSE
ncbi:hypothetical protein NQ317_009668 [Molorchus minor]|uniref:Uncharacterized protein n=1 Tax=Molorchus minor TaxID=1323400 RepID=A0ABQ9JJD1_9CUCU|nr:hypothetical protein NQ317_009668 [Molorchus minor]